MRVKSPMEAVIVSQEQSGNGAGASAEERTQETRRFVRGVMLT